MEPITLDGFQQVVVISFFVVLLITLVFAVSAANNLKFDLDIERGQHANTVHHLQKRIRLAENRVNVLYEEKAELTRRLARQAAEREIYVDTGEADVDQ